MAIMNKIHFNGFNLGNLTPKETHDQVLWVKLSFLEKEAGFEILLSPY